MQPVVQAMCVGAEDPKFFDEQAGLSSFVSTFACDVVRACFNSRQVILLHDASTDATFQSDPYVTTTKLKSVLCVPVFNKDVFAGVLYLHNKSFKGAFLPRRMPLLNILTTQMAISLENAEALTQLTANNKELERLGSVKDRFLATTSHELRTPLNGILGTASTLADTTLNMEQREYVDTIVSSGELLRSLLTDLIDLSKLQSGRMRLLNRDLELGALLEHCVSVLAPLANQKGLRLTLVDETLVIPTPPSCHGDAAAGATELSAVDEDVDASSSLQQWIVRADQSRLQQIVLNLVNNAIKFTSKGGVTINVSARLDEEGVKPLLEIAVIDTGIGIAAEEQHRIFEAFAQVDDSMSRATGGVGLGLAISRDLARLMEGDLLCKSVPDVGTTFRLQLPLRIPAQPRQAQEALQPPPVGNIFPRFSGCVLVVEDSPTNREVAVMTLQELGLECDIAEDGREALERLHERRYSLVLMDCQMPVMDGYEATRALRKLEEDLGWQRTPVIALTANAVAGNEARCFGAGMDDFVPKPFEIEDLVKALKRYLSIQRAA